MKKFDEIYYVRQVLNGNQSAFASIVNQYKNMGMTIAMRILKNRDEAEEALQDSFLRAYLSLQNFNLESKFSTWFYRIVFNQSVSYYRRRKNCYPAISSIDCVLDFNELPDISDPIMQINIDEKRAMAEMAISELDEISATVVTLYYLDECSTAEIAEITSLNRQNIKTILFRARKRMYIVLEKYLKKDIKEVRFE